MYMLVLVIKHIELVDELVKELVEVGLHGGTILESTGMASILENMEDMPMFSMLRHLFEEEDEKESSRTMFFVVSEDELQAAREVIKRVTGGLNKPNTGIMFAVPVSFVEGLGA